MSDIDWLADAYAEADSFPEFSDLAGLDTSDPMEVVGEILYRWETERRVIALDPLGFSVEHGRAHHFQPDIVVDLHTIGHGIEQMNAAETDAERDVALGVMAAAYDDIIAGVR